MQRSRLFTALIPFVVCVYSVGSLYPAEKKVGSPTTFFSEYSRTTSFPEASTAPTDRQRPAPMGVSISTTPTLPFITAGTAGLRVRSLLDPNFIFILSSNSVLGAKGPTLCPNSAQFGDGVLQPGTLDIGLDPGLNLFHGIGAVGGVVPLDFTPGADNVVDAAVAFTLPQLSSTEILGIGEPNPTLDDGIVALPGMAVTKSGRTTGVTRGIVTAINVTAPVHYAPGCGTAHFVGQVAIFPGEFAASGDSGSSILQTATDQPVGLLFAGSPNLVLANQILLVYLNTGTVVDGEFGPLSGEELVAQTGVLKQNPAIGNLMEIQGRWENNILAIRGVVGMGIGLAEEGQDYAFVVFVKKKTLQVERLTPRRLEGVSVRLVESGEFEAY